MGGGGDGLFVSGFPGIEEQEETCQSLSLPSQANEPDPASRVHLIAQCIEGI